ncbi:hypothetical protein D9M71_423040 [compost metagenome]
MLRHAETACLGHHLRGDWRQGLAHLVGAAVAHQQEPRRLRQPDHQHQRQQQRQHATDDQQAVPAVGRDHLGRNEATTRHAQVEATEHAGHQQRLEALRGVFGQQRGSVGHACTQAQASQEAQYQQLVDVGGIGRSQAEATKYQHRPHQHAFAAETVSQGPGAQGAEHHADQRGTHDRPKAGAVDSPLLRQCRGDETHGSSVQAIEEDDQKAQQHDSPLIAGQRLLIDERLNVEAFADVGLRLIHYCYPE